MSLIATRLDAIKQSDPNYSKNMRRPSQYGALDLFFTETFNPNGIISRELYDRTLRSIGRDVQIPVIEYDGTITLNSNCGCEIPENISTSALVDVNFTNICWGFTMVPVEYYTNYITYAEDFQKKFFEYLWLVAKRLDEMAVATLDANKTQVFENLLYYTETGDSVQVPWSMRESIFGDLAVMMEANDYYGRLHIVGNSGVRSIVEKLRQFGEYNMQNKQYEYIDKIFHFTNNIENEANVFATGYAVEEGQVGMLFQIPWREALNGTGPVLTHEWGIETLPYLGIPVATHTYQDVGNQSAIGGASTADMTCVVREHFGFSISVAFLTAYNSDPTTIANPIIKFEVLASDSPNPLAFPVVVENGQDNPVYTQTAP